MADEFDIESASGSALRDKLEETLKTNKSLSSQNSELLADRVIREKGFSHISAEDLVGLEPGEIEDKAQQLEDDAAKAEADTLRKVLSRQGLEGDKLDEAVASMLKSDGKSEQGVERSKDDDSFSRVRELNRSAGGPVRTNTDGLSPRQKMELDL